MLKKIISYLLISCLLSSVTFAEVTYAVKPGSFAVKVEYVYSDGNRMIVSWNEGKEKHTLYPVTEGSNPINLLTYYKAGKLYPASSPTTQMWINDDNGNKNLFNIDTAGASTTQTVPKSHPGVSVEQHNDDADLAILVTVGCAIVLIIVLGWLYNGQPN